MSKFGNKSQSTKFGDIHRYDTCDATKRQIKWDRVQDRILCSHTPTIVEEYTHDLDSTFECSDHDNLSRTNPMHTKMDAAESAQPLEIEISAYDYEDTPPVPPCTPISKCRNIYDVLRAARKKSFLDLMIREESSSDPTV